MKKLKLLALLVFLSLSINRMEAQTPVPTINGTPPPFSFTGPGVSQSGQTFTFSGSSGTVNSGTTGQLAYYATTGTAVSGENVPTWNQNTTGNAATATTASNLSISGQTGLLSFTGLTSTNRVKTLRDAADTILELGGSYTPSGTWAWTSASVTWPTFNQNTTGYAAGIASAGGNCVLYNSAANTTTGLACANNDLIGMSGSAPVAVTTLPSGVLGTAQTFTAKVTSNFNVALSNNATAQLIVQTGGSGNDMAAIAMAANGGNYQIGVGGTTGCTSDVRCGKWFVNDTGSTLPGLMIDSSENDYIYHSLNATNGTNQNSVNLYFEGSYYNSSATEDIWGVQNVVGTGSSPTSTLTISKVSGSAGVSSVSVLAALAANSLSTGGHLSLTSTTAPTASSCGGGTAVGNDNVFQVTGISTATACTVTFNTALQQGYCTANGAVALVTVPSGTSKSAITFGITSAETTITAHCS